MADNVGITPGSGDKAASRSVTYSGETAQVQIVGLSVVSGPDDAKTVEDVSAAAPLPVRMDQGPGALVTENGALRVDPTQVSEQAQEVLNATGLKSLGDEPLQMVGLHPSFPLPIDTAMPMPVAGQTEEGGQKQVAVGPNGGVSPADMRGPFLLDFLHAAATTVDLNLLLETTGFNSIAVHISLNPGSIFRVLGSHDRTNWSIIEGFNLNSSNLQFIDAFVTPSSILVYPAHMRFIKFQLTGTPGGRFRAHVYMRSAPYGFGQRTQGVNLTQISGAAITGNAQLGVNVFGPSLPNAAHSTNNPVQISGSDGTFVRRILTDVAGNTQVVGGLVAGASALLSTTGVRPVQQGVLDGEGRVRHVVGTTRGQINVRQDDATTTSEAGVIDALNDVVRELKLLNARIADLPYWLGVGAAMPDDASTFRDDPYIFNQ